MILYDESYNFLGMSEKILNRLGYEDLDEFCTYHRDFADLFEKENGLIYNFENFSWIDFILYGGANKDTAIIKTKSGEKYSVKIKIEEIKIKDDTIGISKLYSIKLAEDKVVENQTQQITNNKINLSSMLDEKQNTSDESIKIKKEEPKKEIVDITNENLTKKSDDTNLDINLSFIKNEDIKEDTKTTKPSFTLDFLKKDEDDKQIEETTEEITQSSDKSADNSEVVLNFFNSTIEDKTSTDEESVEIKVDEKKDTKEQKIEEKPTTPNVNLSFLNQSDDKEPAKEYNNLKTETEKKDIEEPKIELNFLKVDDENDTKPKEEEKEVKQIEQPTINLNFLKDEKVETEKPKEEKKIDNELKIDITAPTPKSDNNSLNFLKIDEDKKEEKSVEPEINLNFLKVEEKVKDENPQELKINLLQKEEENEEDISLSPEKKTKIIAQIKDDIDEIDQPQIKEKEESNSDSDIVINDALKSILNITPQKEQKEEDKQPKLKIELPKENIQLEQNIKSTQDDFDFLPNINLSKDEKKGILKDFIDDTSYNISLIQKYQNINDISSIKFLAIKIKSSAEILGLKDITDEIDKITDNNTSFENIGQYINSVYEKLNNLKKYL